LFFNGLPETFWGETGADTAFDSKGFCYNESDLSGAVSGLSPLSFWEV